MNNALTQKVDTTARTAMWFGRVDIVEWFFVRGKFQQSPQLDECVEEAKEMGNEEIITIVLTWAKNVFRKRREGRRGC
jgi:hypothetical protein